LIFNSFQEKNVSNLKQFDPPANISDFPSGSPEDQTFRREWSGNIDRMTQQTIQNLPWAFNNQGHLSEYYNPLVTDIPSTAATAAIKWIAFPNRILQTFPNAHQREQWQYADEGPPDIEGPPDNYGKRQKEPYTPVGPRGWQDEYCEWSVTRNAEGKITRVMFTCENREYWYSLWRSSPAVVVEKYRELVGDQVQEEDLYLLDSSGDPVIDRETGRPAFNDLNKWNNSTTRGAVSLSSRPNALSAEILIAGQATSPREKNGQPVTGGNALLECGPIGEPNRNSDPHISASVNALVRSPSNLQISLKNPVGLYIQEPDFSTFSLPFSAPSSARPADFWTVARGRKRSDPNSIDEILHAVYEVPEGMGFVVGDISIAGFEIEFGSQIVQKLEIALTGLGLPMTGDPPIAQACVSKKQNPEPHPLQMMDLNLSNAGSRDALIPRVEQGSTVDNLVLLAAGADRGATVRIGDGVTAAINRIEVDVDDSGSVFHLTVTIAADAPVGDRSVLVTNADGTAGPAAVGLLEVVPAASLAAAAAPAAMASAAAAPADGVDLKALKPHNKARS
jgi:hypothetical protein